MRCQRTRIRTSTYLTGRVHPRRRAIWPRRAEPGCFYAPETSLTQALSSGSGRCVLGYANTFISAATIAPPGISPTAPHAILPAADIPLRSPSRPTSRCSSPVMRSPCDPKRWSITPNRVSAWSWRMLDMSSLPSIRANWTRMESSPDCSTVTAHRSRGTAPDPALHRATGSMPGCRAFPVRDGPCANPAAPA